MFAEPEENNCFSMIIRGKYQEVQIDGQDQGATFAIVRLYTRMPKFSSIVNQFIERVRQGNKQKIIGKLQFYSNKLTN